MHTVPKSDIPFSKDRTGFFLLMTIGFLVGAPVVLLAWPFSILAVAAPIILAVFFIRPEYGLYAFFSTIIMMTEYFPENDPGKTAFIFQDIDLVEGLPPTLILALLMMFMIYFFRRFFIERKPSRVSIVYLAVFSGILALAALTGLIRGCDLIEIRVDLMQILFPGLCFYLCINVLDSEAKIGRMLRFIFIATIIKAFTLGAYYLMGRGIRYSEEMMAVTYDPSDLLVFSTMLLVLFALSARNALKPRQLISFLTMIIPLLFVIIFSFRRSVWGGLLVSLGIYFLFGAAITGKQLVKKIGSAVLCMVVLANIAAFWRPDLSEHVISRCASIFDAKNDSNRHHYLESLVTLNDIASKGPFLGLGLGSHHAPVRYIDWAPADQPTSIVHNTWIYIWMKTGIPGLGFAVYLVYRYFRHIMQFRTSGLWRGYPALVALIASSGLWVTLSMTSPILAYYHRSFLITLFAAMVLSSIRIIEKAVIKTSESRSSAVMIP